MSKLAEELGGKEGAGKVPFEEALKRLEGIVSAMEEGELTLEELIQRYEEGTKLVEICQAKLAAAELKVSQLEKASGGGLAAKPLEES